MIRPVAVGRHHIGDHAAPPDVRRVMGGGGDHGEPRVLSGQPAQVAEVVQLLGPPGADEQVGTPVLVPPDEVGDHRLDRCQAGAAGDEQQVPDRVRVDPHRAERRAELQHITRSGVRDQGVADPAAGHRADVEGQQPVRAGRVGDRVGPPKPGPARCLQA